jgi:O-Antigen ligase
MNNGISVWFATLLILFLSLYNNKAKISVKVIIIAITIILFFSVNLLLVQYKEIVLNIMIEFIKFGLIPLYLASQVGKKNDILKHWYYIGGISALIWLIFINKVIGGGINYMSFGVQMTYSFLVFTIYFYLKKKYKIINLLFMIVTFSCIFFFGNRVSALTCILVIIFFELRQLKRNNILYLVSKASLIILLFIILLINIQNIFYWLRNVMNEYGINSYLIDKIIFMFNNGLSEASSGRDVLYTYSLDIIKESFLLPRGIGYFQNVTGSIYPHNLFLELVITFGILALPIVIYFINIVKKNVGSFIYTNKIILVVLMIFALSRLNFSGTMWSEPVLWIVFGLLISRNKSNSS